MKDCPHRPSQMHNGHSAEYPSPKNRLYKICPDRKAYFGELSMKKSYICTDILCKHCK